jgi:hypothetical protein
VKVATIHQRLRDERGLAVRVASLRRHVAGNLPEEVRRSQVTVLRLVPAEPGRDAQIDYGQMGRWIDLRHGLAARTEFVPLLALCMKPCRAGSRSGAGGQPYGLRKE